MEREPTETEIDKRKKDKSKKEKGYKVFEPEDSCDEPIWESGDEEKSKGKKLGKPSFRFGKKELAGGRWGEKKWSLTGVGEAAPSTTERKRDDTKQKIALFGVPLHVAAQARTPSSPFELPTMLCDCIQYVDEFGLRTERIYKVSGVKSKTHELIKRYQKGKPVNLRDSRPEVVAALIKTFLRALPDEYPVLTTQLRDHFEAACTMKSHDRLVEVLKDLIMQLPAPNRDLLACLIVHLSHVVHFANCNKMTLENVVIVFGPLLRIPHVVLHTLIALARQLFPGVVLSPRSRPTADPASAPAQTTALHQTSSRVQLELPSDPTDLQRILAEKEALLSKLHQEIQSGQDSAEKADLLWELQMVCTQIKRKLKKLVKESSMPEVTGGRGIEDGSGAQTGAELQASVSSVDDLKLSEAPSGRGGEAPPEVGMVAAPAAPAAPAVPVVAATATASACSGATQASAPAPAPAPAPVAAAAPAPASTSDELPPGTLDVADPPADSAPDASAPVDTNKQQLRSEILDLLTLMKKRQHGDTAGGTDGGGSSVSPGAETSTEWRAAVSVATESSDAPVACDAMDEAELAAMWHEYDVLRFTLDETQHCGRELQMRLAAEEEDVRALRQKVDQLIARGRRGSQSESSSDSEALGECGAGADPWQLEYERLFADHELLRRKNQEIMKKIAQERELYVQAKVNLRLLQAAV